VLDDTRALQRQLTANDRSKLDEYLTGVRAIEQRIQRTESFGPLPNPGADAPSGIPTDFGEHMDIMYESARDGVPDGLDAHRHAPPRERRQ